MILYDDAIWWCYGWVCDGLSISSALVWKLIDLIGGELPTQWAPPLMPMGSKSPRVLLNFERRQIWPVDHCSQNHAKSSNNFDSIFGSSKCEKNPWILWMWDSRVTTNGVPTAQLKSQKRNLIGSWPRDHRAFGPSLVQKRPVANQGRIVFGSFPVVPLVSCQQNAVAIKLDGWNFATLQPTFSFCVVLWAQNRWHWLIWLIYSRDFCQLAWIYCT